MKIFNWVHRRFTHKDGFSQNVKKGDHILTKDGDTQALLDNVVLADLLDGWKGGILAIGTLGLDSLNDLKEEKEYCQYIVKDEEAFGEDEYSVEGERDDELDLDEEEEEEEGELNPLVCSASINGLDGSNCDQAAPPRAASSIITIDGTPLSPRDDDHASDSDSNKWDHHYMIKKERITLADLFSAESDGKTNSKDRIAQPQLMSKKPTPDAAKLGQSFSKKLIPGVKDDSRPLKKLQQLMKRMLKRKIHPDGEAKIHKDSRSKSSCATEIPSDELGINESVSLLQIQDMVCMVRAN